jgi:signal transduction histidine kinase
MKRLSKKFPADQSTRMRYAIVFALLLLSYLLTLYVNRQLQEEAELANHTNQVLTNLESILSYAKDAETGSRGFTIMKDQRFLEPYFVSKTKLDSVYHQLSLQLESNKIQQERLASLWALINQRIDLIKSDISFLQDNNQQVGDTIISHGYEGKNIMDSIRKIITLMSLHEQSILEARHGKMENQHDMLNRIVLLSLLLAFLLVIYGFITYSRENIARRKADQAVVESQEELKQRIEELAKANNELIQMRSIEKLAATGRMARTIAHEVRNPLTNINLSTDQLKAKIDFNNVSVAPLLEMIERNSDRINSLITDLLNSTKLTEMHYENSPVNQILEDTLKLAEDRIQLRQVQVNKDFATSLKDVSVDPERIKVAFLNIMVNAIEAMETGKGILKIKTEDREGKCLVTIADNGGGIEKDSLSKLFDPYFTSKANGTGLGLTTAQNIVLHHNGSIFTESEIGKGTSFMITLGYAERKTAIGQMTHGS